MRFRYLGMLSCAALALPGLTGKSLGALAAQFKSSNYNPVTGVWIDSSGNGDNATYSGSSTPTLVSGATPNGSAAVSLTGSGSLLLGSSIADGPGYTVFAYLVPLTGSGRNAITGGSNPKALEWDVYNGKDDFLTEYTADVASGAATLSNSNFSLIDLAVSASGSNFNLNGSADGMAGGGASFASPITRLGNNEGGGDGFSGQIAEIDIYTGVLSSTQISNVEAQLTASYITPVPEPVSAGMLGLGSIVLLARRKRWVKAGA